jgi:hypothetical protein
MPHTRLIIGAWPLMLVVVMIGNGSARRADLVPLAALHAVAEKAATALAGRGYEVDPGVFVEAASEEVATGFSAGALMHRLEQLEQRVLRDL